MTVFFFLLLENKEMTVIFHVILSLSKFVHTNDDHCYSWKKKTSCSCNKITNVTFRFNMYGKLIVVLVVKCKVYIL